MAFKVKTLKIFQSCRFEGHVDGVLKVLAFFKKIRPSKIHRHGLFEGLFKRPSKRPCRWFLKACLRTFKVPKAEASKVAIFKRSVLWCFNFWDFEGFEQSMFKIVHSVPFWTSIALRSRARKLAFESLSFESFWSRARSSTSKLNVSLRIWQLSKPSAWARLRKPLLQEFWSSKASKLSKQSL